MTSRPGLPLAGRKALWGRDWGAPAVRCTFLGLSGLDLDLTCCRFSWLAGPAAGLACESAREGR